MVRFALLFIAIATFVLSSCAQKHANEVSIHSDVPNEKNHTEVQKQTISLPFKKYAGKMDTPLNQIDEKTIVIIREDRLGGFFGYIP